MFRILALAVAMLAQAGDVGAQQGPAQDRVGDAYEIRLRNTMETATDDGMSGSSRSGGLLVERVLAVRDDGLELEFDLPPDTSAEDRARDWAWPARMLKMSDGSLHLLNAPELETRIDAWLALGDMSREACGRWIFTWNAFKIECDPQSVISTLAAYDLRIRDLRAGASYAVQGGLEPTPLRMDSTGPEGSVFVSETQVDADAVRRERAESDVVVAEIMGEPKTLEAALEVRASEQITGTITTTLTVDVEGRVTDRTTVTHLIIRDVAGAVERTTSTQSVERRRL
jgi:hypothetical protein